MLILLCTLFEAFKWHCYQPQLKWIQRNAIPEVLSVALHPSVTNLSHALTWATFVSAEGMYHPSILSGWFHLKCQVKSKSNIHSFDWDEFKCQGPPMLYVSPGSLWVLCRMKWEWSIQTFQYIVSISNFQNNFFLLWIIVKVSNFNRAQPRPDIIEEEKMYSYPSHITSEVGFR